LKKSAKKVHFSAFLPHFGLFLRLKHPKTAKKEADRYCKEDGANCKKKLDYLHICNIFCNFARYFGLLGINIII
jgi:hypothetical protein